MTDHQRPINEIVGDVLADLIDRLNHHHPMTSPPITKIKLDPEQSEILDDAGVDAFAIARLAMDTDNPRRWVIHLCPIDWSTARDADAVLHGKATARPVRPAIATGTTTARHASATPAAQPAHHPMPSVATEPPEATADGKAPPSRSLLAETNTPRAASPGLFL